MYLYIIDLNHEEEKITITIFEEPHWEMIPSTLLDLTYLWNVYSHYELVELDEQYLNTLENYNINEDDDDEGYDSLPF